MDSNKRLEVLSRQLCAANLSAGKLAPDSSTTGPELLDAQSLQLICPKQLAEVLVHDNPDVRNAAFEMLRVRLADRDAQQLAVHSSCLASNTIV